MIGRLVCNRRVYDQLKLNWSTPSWEFVGFYYMYVELLGSAVKRRLDDWPRTPGSYR